MSDTATVPFKPESLGDKVRERIQASFVDLVPEDVWKGMVQKAIDDFNEAKSSA